MGTHRVPAISYPYYDTELAAYEQLQADPVEIVTPGTATGRLRERTLAAPLMLDRHLPWTARLEAPAGWVVLILVGGPLLALLISLARRGWWRGRFPVLRAPSPAPAGGLDELAPRFRRKIEGLVPDQGLREGHSLADALRAAGVETAVAEHAARVRDRLRLARFGPEGATDADELAAEVREVLKVLSVQTAPPGGMPMKAAMLLALIIGGAGQTAAQAPEYLYEAGAYRAAADSFARRAQAEPNVPDHWYNLGNALEQLDQPVAARAAWLRVARLMPRARDVRRALQRRPAPDPVSAGLTRVAWLTPEEWFLAAAVLWLAGWLLLGAWSRLRLALPILLVAVGAAAYGMHVQRGYETVVALVWQSHITLREAPYASAPQLRELGEGVALVVVRVRGGWLLVRRGDHRGWVPVGGVEVI